MDTGNFLLHLFISFCYIIFRENTNYVEVDPIFNEKSSSSIVQIPTMKDISQQEEYLTKQHPKLLALKENLKTLDASLVDIIEAGNVNNPPNVKRVEFILPEENYDELFPIRHRSYTYKRFLQVKKVENNFESFKILSILGYWEISYIMFYN